MKTIEDVSKEFSEKSVWACPISFKAGVEFAQRWISVEDELPEEQGYYLDIAPRTFPKNCNVVVAEFHEDNMTFYSEIYDYPIVDATHWRPIELK